MTKTDLIREHTVEALRQLGGWRNLADIARKSGWDVNRVNTALGEATAAGTITLGTGPRGAARWHHGEAQAEAPKISEPHQKVLAALAKGPLSTMDVQARVGGARGAVHARLRAMEELGLVVSQVAPELGGGGPHPQRLWRVR